MKRLFDAAVAGVALAVSSPLIAVLAAAVKLESPGPAFFVQTRVGRHRRPIRVSKLRTMAVNASGPMITASHDPRITRVGRFLRKTKLDELPQLWNVLRGDMSLVGPRPEVARYVDMYRPEWEPLFDVRPGLTDIASLTFRDEEQLLARARDRERAYVQVVMPMKLALALEGVANSSLREDLRTMVRTALAVLRPRDPMQDPVIRETLRKIEELDES